MGARSRPFFYPLNLPALDHTDILLYVSIGQHSIRPAVVFECFAELVVLYAGGIVVVDKKMPKSIGFGAHSYDVSLPLMIEHFGNIVIVPEYQRIDNSLFDVIGKIAVSQFPVALTLPEYVKCDLIFVIHIVIPHTKALVLDTYLGEHDPTPAVDF